MKINKDLIRKYMIFSKYFKSECNCKNKAESDIVIAEKINTIEFMKKKDIEIKGTDFSDYYIIYKELKINIEKEHFIKRACLKCKICLGWYKITLFGLEKISPEQYCKKYEKIISERCIEVQREKQRLDEAKKICKIE